MDESLICYCGYDLAAIEKMIEELFSRDTPTDDILTVSDRLAVLKKRKISIPEQIAMVGFTNLKAAYLLEPSLTTVVCTAFG